MSTKCDVQGEGSKSYKALISVQIAVQHTALLESWFFHLFGFGHDPIRCGSLGYRTFQWTGVRIRIRIRIYQIK